MKTDKEIISSYGDVILYRKKNIWKISCGDNSMVGEYHSDSGITETIKIAMNRAVGVVEPERGIK